MATKEDTWQLGEASRIFILGKLNDNSNKIQALRGRWKIDGEILHKPNNYPAWRERIERECQHLRRQVRISEEEVYFAAPDALLAGPIFSSELEGRMREENWGNDLDAVFALEIRALGAVLEFPAAWDDLLKDYILYDELRYGQIYNHGITISVRFRTNEEYGMVGENVCLTLNENTATLDLDNFWNNTVKPFLSNIPARSKEKTRAGRNSPIFEKLLEQRQLSHAKRNYEEDPATGKSRPLTDKDIALSCTDDKEKLRLYGHLAVAEEKKMDKKFAKRTQNTRQYRSKHRTS